jgi:uncharacterized protein YjiK
MVLIITGMACITLEEERPRLIKSGKYEYCLANPEIVYELPGRLEEVSGLDYLGDGIILCIEDEKGVLYFYNTRQKKVTREIEFAKSGDYEGVTHIGNTAYVIKSNGKLYSFPIDLDNKVDAKKIDTPLNSSNNVEGLCAGHKKNELYLACKDNAEVNKNSIDGRAVYAFDLKKEKLMNSPYIHLTSEIFKEALKQNGLKSSHYMPFKPSGIALHPITRDVFIIGSVGKLIIVLSQSGKIISAAPLSRKLLRQPEGICFDDQGRLYISSEGRGRKGYIVEFNPGNSKNCSP